MARAKKKNELFTVTVMRKTILPDPDAGIPEAKLSDGVASLETRMFEQTVESLNLKAVIDAVNNPKPK